jgi:trafficking protein particle complex subunit 8
MKRSLGLHCGILRLNSVHDEKDAVPIGKSTWISAGEELAYLGNPSQVPTISSDDKMGLHKFVRDMVTQSIIPHMERCITMWNDQVHFPFWSIFS